MKRGRGRPRIHSGGTETITIRVPVELKAAIVSAMLAIKLYNQDLRAADGVVLAEALKARLKMLENANPDGVRRKIARLDSTLANNYPHLRGPAALPAA